MTYEQLRTRIAELIHPKDALEVLGYDLSLADVLRAIEEVKEEYWNITTQGMIWSKYNDKVAFWKLERPLSGQSQECWDFIGELIK